MSDNTQGPTWEHGTSTGYQYGCRCELCRKTWSAYQKAWKIKNREKNAQWLIKKQS